MLDTDTKRRIDTARDILVGKVPDPKSQVEQITIALIYKFMDDMDADSEEFGGKRSFFAGAFARYGWAKLMRSGLGGHETLNLYAEAIAKMPENPGIPPLFRDIFKNAYLPYRDPETLKAFLKIIDEFSYDHSERLGDAFEYLLSVLGSQGDAGQFRTPRHIIDFVVAIVDPKKTETVLDPACGTAGFLISSYKHILRANTDKKGHSTLTPDDRGRLSQNFKGYDISPDMVRLSLVNLYLHGFIDPHIAEYDTLTSQEKWNEHADVILANPPFMSPKGGIKPHNRFSVQSKRSEVLFVDYMAEHLKPGGRAGIIVPEGIIFQSQTAYTQLRKMLVEEYLVAVISLPAGVFNPYSGVKTSILLLDKTLARQAQTIAFFNIENDGYGLGAQRREIDKNDLPQARTEIAECLRRLRARESLDTFKPTLGLIVSKEKISANGDYNLGGERYREGVVDAGHWPMVALNTVVKIESGSRQKGGAIDAGIPSIGGEQIDENGEIRFDKMKYVSEEHFQGMTKGVLRNRDVLIVKDGATTGKTGFFGHDIAAAVNEHVFILRAGEAIEPYYLYRCVRADVFKEKLRPFIKGIIGGISLEFGEITIPLPPLEMQKEIVAEIAGYQKVIDGARAVLDNYRPHIPIDRAWPIVPLGEICDFKNGLNFDKGSDRHSVRIIGVGDFQNHLYAQLDCLDVVHLNTLPGKDYLVREGDILFVRSNGNPDLVGRSLIIPAINEPTAFSGFTIRARVHDKRATPVFLAHFFKSRDFAEMIKTMGRGANIRNLSQGILNELRIPLPSLSVQRELVKDLETEQALVANNSKLISRFGKKIQAALVRVWGKSEAP